MTRKLLGAFVAAAFALGILSGAAGTIFAGDRTTSREDLAAVMADHMAGADMGAMMSGQMMSGQMMGPDSSAGPGMMSGPAASFMPGSQHELHHPASSPDGSK